MRKSPGISVARKRRRRRYDRGRGRAEACSLRTSAAALEGSAASNGSGVDGGFRDVHQDRSRGLSRAFAETGSQERRETMKPAIHPPLPCGYPTPTTFVILDSPTLVIQPGYEPKSQAEVEAIIQ